MSLCLSRFSHAIEIILSFISHLCYFCPRFRVASKKDTNIKVGGVQFLFLAEVCFCGQSLDRIYSGCQRWVSIGLSLANDTTLAFGGQVVHKCAARKPLVLRVLTEWIVLNMWSRGSWVQHDHSHVSRLFCVLGVWYSHSQFLHSGCVNEFWARFCVWELETLPLFQTKHAIFLTQFQTSSEKETYCLPDANVIPYSRLHSMTFLQTCVLFCCHWDKVFD